MIAQWMAYAAAVALMCGLGALALERALVLYGRPTRWVWAAAMALSVAAPVAARVAPRAASEAAPLAAAPVPLPSAVGPSAGGTMVPLSVLRAIAMADDAEPRTVSLDTPLLVGWTAASAALLAVLGGLAMTLVRRRRVWRREVLDGVAVLVSEDSGPAVVGLFRSDIVVPEWVLHASPAQRELMLVHEEEHVAAGDPRLLGFALALLVLMPWSPALWWQLRRLRLAVEVDCDARVLARRADVRSYGALLLEMGRRASAGMLAVAAFSEPVSFLERRIRIMTTPKVRTRLLRASGFAGVAVLFAAAASATPRPQLPPAAPPAPPAPAAAPRAAVAPAPPAAPAVRVRAAVAPTPPTPPAAPARPAPAPAPAMAPSPPPLPAAAPRAPSAPRPAAAPLPAPAAPPVPAAPRSVTAPPPPPPPAAAPLAPRPPAAAPRPPRAPAPPARVPADTTPRFTPATAEERAAVQRYFPQVLTAGMRGDLYLMFVEDPAGHVVHTARGKGGTLRYGQGTGSELDANAGVAPERISSVNVSRHRAGELGPDSVTVVWVRTGAQAAQPRAATAAAGEVQVRQVVAAIDRYFPSVRTQGAGSDPLMFVVDSRGNVVSHTAAPRQDDAVRSEDIQGVQVFKGSRVQVGSHAVQVIWVTLKEGARVTPTA